jgi:two-component system OmpR family response regulator
MPERVSRPAGSVRRRIEFDAQTWHVLHKLSLDSMKSLQDLANRPFDGLELFQRLKAQSDMPIIFLSANAEMLADLDVGADDYIAKPFSQRLVAQRQGRVAAP